MANDRGTGRNPYEIIRELEDISAGLGEWVKSGTPSNEVTEAIQTRFRSQCDSYSNAPEWFTSLQTPGQRGVALICDPYLDSVGSGPPVVVEPTGDDYIDFFDGVRFEEGISITGDGVGNLCVKQYEVTSRNTNVNLTGLRVEQCNGTVLNSVTFVNLQIVGSGCCIGETNPPPEADPTIEPNPNPRPDPGLDPTEEPFEDPTGQPVFPCPEIPNPFGDPIQLPNLPIPNPFAEVPSPVGTGTGNPNAGPEPVPSEEIDGNPDGTDDDFGEPPEGHIWVGFTVRVSPQGLTHGSWANTGDEPVYREPTGVARPVFDFDGDTVLGNPVLLSQELSSYWLEAAGLPLSGARVSILGSETYSITPYSQPLEEED